jgi:hypothetical protein
MRPGEQIRHVKSRSDPATFAACNVAFKAVGYLRPDRRQAVRRDLAKHTLERFLSTVASLPILIRECCLSLELSKSSSTSLTSSSQFATACLS